ncbi:MAG TPA: glycerol-3-phosphate 1-O-acyltransferase PlsY [Dehalococcoidia bacterium]|nr:glycerol-3-phosphate 1-O-acyltransferase PlsY [Dehalococcoidia bacterium]
MIVNTVIAIIVGYLLGSIPSAYIAGRLKKGVDIRKIGGGNMGALNVIREIGWPAGSLVLIADLSKGILAVFIARWLGLQLVWVLVAGFAAIAGHNWPIFLKFRGGKGGATIMGVLLALIPLEFLSGFVITAVVVIITSNPALGMGVGLAFIPLFIWWYSGSSLLIGYSLFLALFVIARFIISGLRKVPEGTDIKKGLIFSKEYHFWQVKKNQP